MKSIIDGLTTEALLQRVAELRRKGFHPGCDDMSAKSAELWLTVNGKRLLDELRDGSYQHCENYQALLLLEARVRSAYYDCFDRFLAESKFRFVKRSRRPPRNEVNALLSFGNTVLYSYLATEISKTALDVRVGFLHATNRRMESLNLDLAELFKPLVVDRTVFKLINRKQLRPEKHFDRMENGAVWLNAEGKRVFLNEFHEKLQSRVPEHDVSVSYVQLMTEEVRKLARHFRTGEKYKPFKQIR